MPALDANLSALTAEQIIHLLGLIPHPEGGWYRETWRDQREDGSRGAGTAIYYLLGAGEFSAWHRVDATEIWHWYAGGPLRLTLAAEDMETVTAELGNDLAAGQRPQLIVPAHVWQTAQSLSGWTLVGCTVSPAFAFSGFQLAPPDFRPPRG